MPTFQRLALISALFGLFAWLTRGVIGLLDAIKVNEEIASKTPVISWNLAGFNLTVFVVLLLCLSVFLIFASMRAVRKDKKLRTKIVLVFVIACPCFAYASYSTITKYYQNLATKNGYLICFQIKTQENGPDTRQDFLVSKNIIDRSGCPAGLTLGNGL